MSPFPRYNWHEKRNDKVDKSGASGQKLAKNVGHRRITVLSLAEQTYVVKKRKRHIKEKYAI